MSIEINYTLAMFTYFKPIVIVSIVPVIALLSGCETTDSKSASKATTGSVVGQSETALIPAIFEPAPAIEKTKPAVQKAKPVAEKSKPAVNIEQDVDYSSVELDATANRRYARYVKNTNPTEDQKAAIHDKLAEWTLARQAILANPDIDEGDGLQMIKDAYGKSHRNILNSIFTKDQKAAFLKP